MVKEVELTRQVIKGQAGPANDLLNLLQKATRLLQVMAYQLEGQRDSVAYRQAADLVPQIHGEETWEKITLVVENATEPDIAFSYTKALGKLESVREIKLVGLYGGNLHTKSRQSRRRNSHVR
jgi:hypothetical protein